MVFCNILFRLSCLELAEFVPACPASHWQVFRNHSVRTTRGRQHVLVHTNRRRPAFSGEASSCAMRPVRISLRSRRPVSS